MSVAADFAAMYPASITDFKEKSAFDLLNELTEAEAIRREEVCKTCTWCNAAHCLRRYKLKLNALGSHASFWDQQETVRSTAYACDKYKMLLHGKCKKYMSIEQAEVQFAAEGV